ncbi:Crp/Fnr family transcriptional regulator [Granulicella sp. WH15]|uniref:Crp/Fnr family transcriptional regulator n=1 Tax=Granulicella sp. WH15 TaxID=2602070 RepID=UPI00136695E5|nr:Crp/Fnr family transcriptional regulator [Granulicella sp. WH15]QHN03962.1 Crp/Fnr family transcriptional regulator [Granulicella sp. WH15]
MEPAGRDCLTCLVRGTDCFCSLPVEALAELQAIGSHMRLHAGERLLHEGYSADKVYVVCEGRLKLSASSAEGRLLLVRIAGPGDVLGLAAAMKGTEHRLTAESLERCEVKAISRVEFLGFMEKFREVGRNTVASVSLEYEGAIMSARRLALSGSAAGKLASVLLDWGRMGARSNQKEPMEFNMPLTHEELGSMAGISRETVTRLLARFRKEKMVQQDGERITLLQPEKMETLYR